MTEGIGKVLFYLNKNFIIIIVLILGFVLTYNRIHTDTTKLQELVLFTNNTCYHIHHYIWMSIIVILIILDRNIRDKKYINIILAFLIGSSLVDFLFKDWMLIKNNCHKKKIINLFTRLKL